MTTGEDAHASRSPTAGPGVPPEERERIFERFYRGRARGSEGGFGLGLAIGRELAERMGGTLTLADRDGGGTRFTLACRARAARRSGPARRRCRSPASAS